ncbi:ABC transporter ATP-binding protein [Lysinibacter cavernae]|uniref:ABC-2 type transport system ATP-binding protein n=1 Tax=Lysinibacter cavernae TaxID=1640652 RepID=A0A7X5TUX5_9MICO|nr:ABC transporter ATP-binding protein [Lysinibacter cavernae]NIH55104.1 ABC-2 type transport system ATP-binding protein [Lysinibacter cavernae]
MSESTGAPTVVSVESVSKRFVIRKDNSLKERMVNIGRGRKHKEDFWALDDVSVEVRAGSTIGLIGHNGSGKSTLLKVIGGIIDPTSGQVRRRGRMAALLELGAGFHPDLTGRENVYLNAAILGLSKEETDAQFDNIVDFSGISDFIDTQVKFYSSGMYVRLAFSVAIHTDPDILLVDEVLAVGDEAFQRKCMDKIKSFQSEGRTIILVTHNLGQVVELCDHAVLLNKGSLVYQGDAREAVAQFRDILEERRIDDQAHQEERRAGRISSETQEPPFRVTAVASPIGQSDDVPLEPGESLSIQITVDSRESIDAWNCAIQIDNTLGQAVFGTTSKRLGITPSPLVGKRVVEFQLKDCQFGEGKFFVNISIMTPNGEHLYDLPQACSFNTRTPEDSRGSIYISPEFIEHSVA